MTDDKSKLLRSLTIDRSAGKAERSGSRWLPISAAIVACVVAFGAFGAYEFRRQDPPKETASQIAQQPAARARNHQRHKQHHPRQQQPSGQPEQQIKPPRFPHTRSLHAPGTTTARAPSAPP